MTTTMTAGVDPAFLSSQVYNPTFDEKVAALFRTMDSEPVSEELLAEYIQTITSMPTQNPYAGVLFNPRACEVDAGNSLIDDILKDLDDRYKDIVGNGSQGGNHNPTQDQKNTLDEWNKNYPGVVSDLNKSKDVLNEYKNHTDRIIANFPTYSSLIQNNIGTNTGMNGMGGGNPCIPFADILGSILDAGQRVLAMIMGALAALKNAVQQVMAMIQNAMAMVMQAINQALAMIQEELTKLANAMLNMLKMGLAQLMAFLPNDPCLKMILGGLITGAAKKILG